MTTAYLLDLMNADQLDDPRAEAEEDAACVAAQYRTGGATREAYRAARAVLDEAAHRRFGERRAAA